MFQTPIRAVVALAATSLLASTAYAESVRMTGRFAAPYRDAAMLDSLRVGRITGQDGVQLGMAIERALARPDITGDVHFDLVGGRGAQADGMLNGNVTTGVQESRFKRKEKECVEREGGKRDGKCLREEEVEKDCTRRVINVNADLRLASADGRVLYSVSRPRRDETSWCRGQNPPRTTEEAIRGMIVDIAENVRRDIVPSVENYSIRFRESTRGLPKELNRTFKDIVRQTQRDLRGACAAWTAMDAQAPNHPSIVFDLGLCAEAEGDYDRAGALYGRAAQLIGRGSNEGTQGAERIARLIAGAEDEEARRGGRNRP
ncbi:hypothetical protein FPZ54_08190 [Sphingomonas suaedae]|uniref:Tetratricopeptide repeat protein n=1 Tax=Sphingomonas suaedae TaxID=2599297 RepID=A0A518REZ8_9SPHN|nr:hypothetical protein [Sphingomonas suaedae]QDX26003.1 hypothetical protein FPZ54_08190 [Sphingomonas suaedae]